MGTGELLVSQECLRHDPTKSSLAIIAHRAVPGMPHPGHGPRTPVRGVPSSSLTDAQWALLEPPVPPPGNIDGEGDDPTAGTRRHRADRQCSVDRKQVCE
ncbi:hypothetical protein GCM10022140_24410 [Rhodococcus aetherivorans]